MSAGERAVVIGASMSGLLAARVLSPRFTEVVVLERDTLPVESAARKGVPQGQHAHALLASGRLALEKFFPGFRDELIAQGAFTADYTKVRWFDNGVYHARSKHIEALVVGRPRLELHVRHRVRALENVTIKEQHAVESLLMDGGRVTGLRVKPSGGTEQTLDAALVVDASGRGSQTPAWLEQAGFPRPKEEAVRVGLGYTTRVYRRKADHLGGDVAVIIPSAPPARRGGVAISMEGDRWMVTLFGMLGDHPPTDAQGFLDFAKSIPAPDVYNLITDAEPLTEPVPFKFPASTRRRYETVEKFPAGYLVFGDAMCSFNPIYGQGMSTACLQAVALEQCLAEGETGLAKRFFTAASKVLENPWTMAVGGDLRYEEVEGARSGMVKFINWYIGKLHIAASTDPSVANAFHRVANLLDPPPAILQPAIAWRILQGNLRRPQPPQH